MSYCSNCIHYKVCGNEGVDDSAMTFCADKQTDKDLINRQDVEDAIAETIVNGENLGYAVAYDILSDLPSVTDGDLISRREVLKCFNIKELKFKNKEDAELVKHYLELSFNDLAKLSSYNSIKTELNELNGDLISRQDVLDIISDVMPTYSDNYHYILEQRVKDLPSTEKTDINHYRVVDTSYSPYTIDSTTKSYSITIPKVAEKTAEWTKEDECSNCGKYIYVGDRDNYCPHCGCKMKEVK